MVFSPTEDHLSLWHRYLAERLAAGSPTSSPTPDEPRLEDEAIQFLMPNVLERLNAGENGGGLRIPFPNRLPGPGRPGAGPGGPGAGRFGGPGAGQFGGPAAGRFGGGPFGPGRAQQGLFPPPPPRPFMPDGPIRQRRRRNWQGGVPVGRPGAQ
jgi:hypothetical protein